ncbi:Putative mitochondrial import inner membrane translocase subunit Tim54 [Septoria linicola]|uniref:Mitochondrial import inner membrane translocase subunit TIM54 n=1 Tax=Septoria linicola TaxID=215465 RepID=A0A9Q9EFC2_9PEZI|nr:putative mitochondrial import inner membrane translocase subunit Tim54 [Septoria linicola]USW47789.1 Putative mitochondrial import inner membrane translocase subunit Tim54 [Septoria linicola]
MAEQSSSPAGSSAADGATKAADAASKQNPAFRRMGLPRLRLPSRNWTIFWSITGSFAGAVIYDKYQTKRIREKWVQLVSHIADEQLDTKTLPRRFTIYLQAPPGDGLRTAREHFHLYVKPVLVSAAMDWDVVEGRKEGDVRHKTAEKIRKRRNRNGEGDPITEEEDGTLTVEDLRQRNGDVEYPGVAGDIVIGRHTWKEYLRGLHEGYLGPADAPKEPELDDTPDRETVNHSTGSSSVGDVAVQAATEITSRNIGDSPVSSLNNMVGGAASETANNDVADSVSNDDQLAEAKKQQEEEDAKKKAEEEKPKRRFPPSYITPEDYQAASLSPSTPEIIGPSVGVRMPHLLGFMNTPVRIYRFLTRRRLQDDIGRQVAAAILASHRPYSTATAHDESSASEAQVEVAEQKVVLAHEEKDWYKLVHKPRQEHQESVWIEPISLDDRITSRMRAFELTPADNDRAKRIAAGQEAAVGTQDS